MEPVQGRPVTVRALSFIVVAYLHNSEPDPTNPLALRSNQSLISEGTTISELFDQDKWERHRRVARYWRHVTLGSLLSSTVFRRLAWPIGLLTLFSAVVCCVNSWRVGGSPKHI